jgi:hypothetical protein
MGSAPAFGADTPWGARMPGTTPSVRLVTDARDLPAVGEEAAQHEVPAPEVTVARLLACSPAVAAVSCPPE